MLARSGSPIGSDQNAERATTLRRLTFSALVVATMAALLWLVAATLAPGGYSVLDGLILACFAVTLPWTVIGFWNATIGFVLMRFVSEPISAVSPASFQQNDDPITAATAILVCIRNERPERVIRNLAPLLTGLSRLGVNDRFHIYVLSDTDEPLIAELEELQFSALRETWRGRINMTYRRRRSNDGYKAGNVRDFCERWGAGHEFAITLDADSVMSAEAMLRLVRIMQREPRLGILQGMVVGLPSTSAFARLFQFGMRLGMRSFTLGSAWWQADCGPYWGHNAVLRLAPFIAHCQLPVGPSGAHILSHDQIEAVLMRRAGYDVRVLPEEDLGWDDNPPTLLEFIRRDLRWCQGNMQYWPLLRLPDLRPVSRFQLGFAMLMFLNSPAWLALLIMGSLLVAFAGDASVIRGDTGAILLAAVLLLWFAPKIATAADVLARADARRSFGGAWRFCASLAAETLFSFLLLPIVWFCHTSFLIRSVFSGSVGWSAQARDQHSVSWRTAAQWLWPQTLTGIGVLILLATTAPAAVPYALLLAAGLTLAIPFAVVTSWPEFGAWLARVGLGRLPEETSPPQTIAALALPALGAVLMSPVPAQCPSSTS